MQQWHHVGTGEEGDSSMCSLECPAAHSSTYCLTLAPGNGENYCLNYFMLSRFSHVQLCNPMDCSLPGSSVHGILQTRILEWVAIPISMGSNPGFDPTLQGRGGSTSPDSRVAGESGKRQWSQSQVAGPGRVDNG